MKKLFRTSLLFFGLSYFFNLPVLGQWSTATLSQARIDKAATSTGDKAFFAGGYYYSTAYSIVYTDRVDIYNATTNQWSTSQLSQARSSVAAASVGDLAFFAGGLYRTSDPFNIYSNPTFSDRVDIYNATTNQWSTDQLSQARYGMKAATARGKILFAGGAIIGVKLNLVDIYDIYNHQWSTTKLPHLEGVNLIATTVGSKVLFIKSYESGIESSLVDIYDVLTGQWSSTQIPRSYLSTSLPTLAVTSIGDKAFFAEMTSNHIYIYDVPTNVWTTTLLPGYRSNSDYIEAVSLDNKAFFSSSTRVSTNLLDVYDGTTNQWSTNEFPRITGNSIATTAGNKLLFAGATTAAVDIYSTNAALPVNLISFTGKWTESTGAELSWQTSWEINNSHFQIQRSRDAKSFETIGRVEGKGTTSERVDYSFIDSSIPDPTNYYQLKQVDLDGSIHFSTIISVNRQESKQPASLSVWPSPTTGTLTIQLSPGVTTKEVSIYNLHGRKLRSQTGSQPTVDVSSLQTGAYIVDVLTNDGQYVRSRFVKQ